VSFGPASPDAGVELLRQLFLQCTLGISPVAIDVLWSFNFAVVFKISKYFRFRQVVQNE
jgi:hypothetical protein